MLYSPFSDSMVDWLSRDRVTAVLAANVQFESGTAYVHSGTGTLVLGGYVYYGMGTMGAIDDVGETNTTSPTQLRMTLSGLDMSLFAKTLNERCVGRPAELYLVAMDDNGKVITGAQYQCARCPALTAELRTGLVRVRNHRVSGWRPAPSPPVSDLHPAIFTIQFGHQRIDAPGFIICKVAKRQGADPAGAGETDGL